MNAYTWDDVRAHSTVKSCWLVVRDKVYDATLFLEQHPGGMEAILKHAGTDATEDYDFHSPEAQRHWDALVIGRLAVDREQKCSLM